MAAAGNAAAVGEMETVNRIPVVHFGLGDAKSMLCSLELT